MSAARMSGLEAIMRDLYLPAFKEALAIKPGSMLDLILKEAAIQRKEDEAWLASLTPHARTVVLTKRRIARLEARFRAAMDFRRYDD